MAGESSYVVPQFIGVEPRIIGPITIRQFVIVIIGFIIGAALYKFLAVSHFLIFILLALLDASIVILMAFTKINGMPFPLFMVNMFSTIQRPAVRVWRKEVRDFVITGEIGKKEHEQPLEKKHITQSRLTELTLVVNTGGRYAEEVRKYWGREIPRSENQQEQNSEK